MVGKRPHRYEYILYSLVVLDSTVVQYNEFVLILSSRSIAVVFFLVDCNPCILMFRFTIVLFPDLSRCFLMNFYVIPGQVFMRPCFIALRRLAVVGLKSAACK